MKSKVFLILLAVITIILSGCGKEQETSVIDSPEKAIQGFAADVAAGDFDAAMQLCPADTMIKEFDAGLYNKTILSNAQDQSAQTIKSDYARETGYLALTLLQGEATGLGPYDPEDPGWSQQFFKGSNIAKLKDLAVLRVDKPYLEDYDFEVDSDVYRESTKDSAAVWGADAYTERIALLQHNGKTFMAGFTLVQYGGVWGIKSITSDFMDIPSPGGAQQISEEDYLVYVKPQK
jgi:hypothetical protein